MSPPSPMKRVLSVRNSLISCARRSGWIGAVSFMRRGSRSSFSRCSSARSAREPALARLAPCGCGPGGLGDCGEDRAGVADEAERDVAVLADRPVVHVDLDDLGLARQALAVAHPEVERRADDQDHVGVVERVAAGEVEVVRVARRERAAGGAVHVRRDVQLADELDRLLVAARRPDLAAEQHARALGVDEDVGQRGRRRWDRRCSWSTRGSCSARRDDRALERRPCCRGCRAAISRNTGPGAPANASRKAIEHMSATRSVVTHVRGELGDRLHHVDVGQVLQGAHLVLVQGALAADQQERALGAEARSRRR